MPSTTRPIIFVLLALTLLGCKVGPTVSNYDQLDDIGDARVYSIKAGPAGESMVEVAVENTTDDPQRITNMQWTILDAEGFAQATVETENDIEIPARAKEKVTFTVATPARDIVTVRLWGQDLDMRAGAKTPAMSQR